jgi:hypothetical protein
MGLQLSGEQWNGCGKKLSSSFLQKEINKEINSEFELSLVRVFDDGQVISHLGLLYSETTCSKNFQVRLGLLETRVWFLVH